MSLRWTWRDYWEWYESLDTEEARFHALFELLKDGWMKSLPSQTQIEVLKSAPREILDYLYQMPEVFKSETIEWSRHANNS